jgi:hypothetical protein
VPKLVILVGNIAAGKNTVAEALAATLMVRGCTSVIADVDDVAAMVTPPGAASIGHWFTAHEAHGALVGQWMKSTIDYIIVVGPLHSLDEQEALTRFLPADPSPLWVVVHAPVAVTLQRAQADATRGRSRDPEFHNAAYARFIKRLPGIPAHLSIDSSKFSPADIVAAIDRLLIP